MERLKNLRIQKGLTQKQLADLLNVDRTSIVKYETGKNGPTSEVLERLADIFDVSTDYLLGRQNYPDAPQSTASGSKWIPVLGKVAAGTPISTIEDILDYEEISPEMAKTGDFFALQIKGDSMEPRIMNGDVVIVRKQTDCEDGEVAVVIVNGDEATVKRIKKRPEGLMLIPSNQKYEPMFYSNEEIEKLPITIIGKVVELRGKF